MRIFLSNTDKEKDKPRSKEVPEEKTLYRRDISIDITMTQSLLEKPVLRFPRLDTVMTIEEFIQEHDGEYKKKQLWDALPKKIMYQTFSIVIDYLLYSKKISLDAEGKIGWIFYPGNIKSYAEQKHLFWKKK